jgi:hypothetical protein
MGRQKLSIEVTEQEPNKEQYVCRFCDETSRWFTPEELEADKIPRGWRFDEHIGLRCAKCVKSGRKE